MITNENRRSNQVKTLILNIQTMRTQDVDDEGTQAHATIQYHVHFKFRSRTQTNC